MNMNLNMNMNLEMNFGQKSMVASPVNFDSGFDIYFHQPMSELIFMRGPRIK